MWRRQAFNERTPPRAAPGSSHRGLHARRAGRPLRALRFLFRGRPGIHCDLCAWGSCEPRSSPQPWFRSRYASPPESALRR
eukprot:9441634-Alexandrium_andersonii.AAC.1